MMGFDRHELVRGHFSGGNSAFGDRRLFRHLRRCESCRGEYRTYAALESLDRDGDTRARERMARAIFPPASRRPALFGASVGVLALASAAFVISAQRSNDHFQARGGVEQPAARATPSLEVFRLGSGGRSERAGSTIRADEALAFSFVNPRAADGTPGGASFLMVFARDAGGHVFWFWPAWDNPADDPGSLPIATTLHPMELGESVRHPLQAGPLTIFGLFTERRYHVTQIEAALSQGPNGLGGLGGFVWTETVEVLR
jgi:hypothetical protein